MVDLLVLFYRLLDPSANHVARPRTAAAARFALTPAPVCPIITKINKVLELLTHRGKASGDSRMKAEHRKHLETNTLVEGLGKLNQGLHQGLPRGVWMFLGGVAVVLILFYTWRYFSERSQRLNAALWCEWEQLDGSEALTKGLPDQSLGFNKEKYDLDRLEKFGKDNAGTVQGRLARFQLARLFLYDGLRDLGHSTLRNQARENLKGAADKYAELIKEARDIPVLHQEAMLNCAKAHESLGDTA